MTGAVERIQTAKQPKYWMRLVILYQQASQLSDKSPYKKQLLRPVK